MNIPAYPNQNITINDEQLKQTNKFTYLGSVISSEDGSKADIKRLGLLSTVIKYLKIQETCSENKSNSTIGM